MTKKATAVDHHVASRLRAARLMAGLSQEKAAEHIGLTFQQVQKYEKGTNRVSAGCMASLCKLYGVPVAWLFEGAPGVNDTSPGDDIGTTMMTLPYGAEIARDYAAITCNQARSVVAQVTHALAARP